jgi:hypothetical protein
MTPHTLYIYSRLFGGLFNGELCRNAHVLQTTKGRLDGMDASGAFEKE